MELKAGYKYTKAGMIPEDWDASQLGELFTFKNGLNKAKQFFGKGTPIVNYMDVYGKRGLFSHDLIGRVTLSKQELKRFDVRKGDVCFTRTSETVDEVGISSVILDDVEDTVFSGFVLRARPKDNSLDNEFKKYCFSTSAVRNQITSQSSETTRALTNGRHLSVVAIACPSLPEQRAIAAALSDVDALITSLDKLIAKKRLIKQGVMQELLLSRYGWVEKRLGDTAILKARIGWQGLTTAEYLDTGNFYLVTGTDFKDGFIDWSNCHFVEDTRYKQDQNIQLRKNDVLVTKDGTIGKVAFVNHLEKPATLNSGVFVIRPIDKAFYPMFFYYLLLSNVFTDFLHQLSAGSTINHLYQKDFINFTYETPSKISEQKRIANILADMDTEIAALEKRRDKTRLLKQGMMQELLTGRIRLL
jgi:type I restriction enzyme, S subunit